MSAILAGLAQLPIQTDPAADTALAKLARAAAGLLQQAPGQTIEGRIVALLPGGLTQLQAGGEALVLRLEPQLPPGTAIAIKVAIQPDGRPALSVQPLPQLPQAQPAAPAPLPQISTQLAVQAASTPATATAVPPQANSAALPATVPLALAGSAPVAPPASLVMHPATPAPSITAAAPAPVPGAAVLPMLAVDTPETLLPPQMRPVALPATAPLPVASQAAPPALPPSLATPAVPAASPAVTAPQPAPVAAPAQPTSAAPAIAPPQLQPTLPVNQPAPTVSQLTATPSLPQLPAAVAPPSPAPALPAVPLSAAVPDASSLVQHPVAAPAPRPPQPFTAPLSAQVLSSPAQAAARQDSAAPLLARLSSVAASGQALPQPVVAAALRLMATRIDLNRAVPDGAALKAAVLGAGVLVDAAARPRSADAKSALLQLRSALLGALAGGSQAVDPVARRAPPPLRGDDPRVTRPELPPLADGTLDETMRTLLGHAESAISRLKLLQLASQPTDARPGGAAPAAEFRVEVPMLLGAETGILQLVIQRDAKKRDQPTERGWRMRFALAFSAIGEVGADVALLGKSTSVAIWAAKPTTAAALDEMLPELAAALAARGLSVAGLRVRRGAPVASPASAGRLLDSAR